MSLLTAWGQRSRRWTSLVRAEELCSPTEFPQVSLVCNVFSSSLISMHLLITVSNHAKHPEIPNCNTRWITDTCWLHFVDKNGYIPGYIWLRGLWGQNGIFVTEEGILGRNLNKMSRSELNSLARNAGVTELTGRMWRLHRKLASWPRSGAE